MAKPDQYGYLRSVAKFCNRYYQQRRFDGHRPMLYNIYSDVNKSGPIDPNEQQYGHFGSLLGPKMTIASTFSVGFN